MSGLEFMRTYLHRRVFEYLTCFGVLLLLVLSPDCFAYKPAPPPPPLSETLRYAKLGDTESQFALGMHYLRGENGAERDPFEARKWFSMAAMADYASSDSAKWILGSMMYYGVAGPVEKLKGLQLQSQAVESFRGGAYVDLAARYFQVGRFHEAEPWLRKAIEARVFSDGVAHRLLGMMYLRGDALSKNESLAAQHLCLAAYQNDDIALLFLSGLYATGQGVEKNLSYSNFLIRESASRGVDFSSTLFKESPPLGTSDQELVKEITMRAQRGDASALLSLGVAHRFGREVALSSELAINYLSRPELRDNPDAQYHLAQVLASFPSEFRDRDREFRLLEAAGNSDHAHAIFSFGKHINDNARTASSWANYASGYHLGGFDELVKQSRKYAAESLEWLQKAGQRGEPRAYETIASRYSAGVAGGPRIAPRDPNLELKYLRLAAEMGRPQTQYRVGRQYLYGVDGKKNVSEARRWFKLAAETQMVLGRYWVLAARKNLMDLDGDESLKVIPRNEICSHVVGDEYKVFF